MNRAITLLGLSLLLAGCASMKTNEQTARPAEGSVQIVQDEDSSRQVVRNIQQPYVSPLGKVPLDDNKMVDTWLRYFQGKGRRHMEIYLERSSRYIPMMKNVLRENGLPEELVYVALIESGFSPRAHSRANAVGYWQFIRSTGRLYGLKVDSFIDERRDPVLSTRAAAEYFKALYNLFGSWHLALAAYNSGENRIKNAVMKRFTRDFWALAKGRALPKETKQYVPKFIAAAMIAEAPEQYGFTNIAYDAALEYETIAVANPLSMSRMASAMGIEEEQLRLLNPKFRGDYIPLYRGNEIVLRVPVGMTKQANLAAASSQATETPKISNSDFIFYRVRSGDSLSTIARKHRTSVATLRRINNMGPRSFLRAGHKILVPDRGDYYYEKGTPDFQYAGAETAQASAQVMVNEKNVSFHVVRRGESLSHIAKRYGTSIDELRRLNNLNSRSILHVGQRIRVKEDEKAQHQPAKALPVKVAKKIKRGPHQVGKVLAVSKKTHVVRRGETLSTIAQKYQISMGKLVKANSLKSRGTLLAGRALVIPDQNISAGR